jgi:ABC-2 type transport system ATP-binding protein
VQLIALDTPDALAFGGQPRTTRPTMEDAFIHLVESADRQMEVAA